MIIGLLLEFIDMHPSETDIQVLALTQVNIQVIQVIKVNLRLATIEKNLDDIKKLFHSIRIDIEDEHFDDLDGTFRKIRKEISFLVEERVNKSSFNLDIYDFDLKIIQSIYAIISKYKEVCNKVELDEENIFKLKQLADNLADKYSNYLNKDFWFRHKFCHYLKSKKLLKIYCNNSRSNWGINSQQILELYQNEIYNQEELIKFFDENANYLLPSFVGCVLYIDAYYNKTHFHFYLFKYQPNLPFYCFDDEEQVFAFMMYIEMEKLNELYQSLEHHGKDILNG